MPAIATSYAAVGTAVVLGSIVGLSALRDATNDAATDVAEAVLSLDPSYAFTGQRNAQAWTAGSRYIAPRVVVEEVETDADGNAVVRRFVLREPPYQAIPARPSDGWGTRESPSGIRQRRTRVIQRGRTGVGRPEQELSPVGE